MQASRGPSPGSPGVSHRYGATTALGNVSLELPSGRMIGLIGPDAPGQVDLAQVNCWRARKLQAGSVGVSTAAWARRVIAAPFAHAYLYALGLGKNLYRRDQRC